MHPPNLFSLCAVRSGLQPETMPHEALSANSIAAPNRTLDGGAFSVKIQMLRIVKVESITAGNGVRRARHVACRGHAAHACQQHSNSKRTASGSSEIVKCWQRTALWGTRRGLHCSCRADGSSKAGRPKGRLVYPGS